MKLTRSQQEEVDFLEKSFLDGQMTTDEERKEYFDWSERGIGSNIKNQNSLGIAKSRLNISASSWKEDLTIGLLGIDELLEDESLKSPYFTKFIDSLMKSIDKEYRIKVFRKNNNQGTALALTNFPEIMKIFDKTK